MSEYTDADLASMSTAKLQDLHATAVRIGSSRLSERIADVLTARKLKSGKRTGGRHAYYRRRADWFVERGDGLRIPVLHSLRLGADGWYRDDRPQLLESEHRKKYRDLVDALRVTEFVVVQKDVGDGTSRHWHCDGYLGLFRIVDRQVRHDGSFQLKLATEPGFIPPRMRETHGG